MGGIHHHHFSWILFSSPPAKLSPLRTKHGTPLTPPPGLCQCVSECVRTGGGCDRVGLGGCAGEGTAAMAKRARTTTTTTITTATVALATAVFRMSLSLLLMVMVMTLPTVVTALGHPTGVGGHSSHSGGGLKLSQVDGKVRQNQPFSCRVCRRGGARSVCPCQLYAYLYVSVSVCCLSICLSDCLPVTVSVCYVCMSQFLSLILRETCEVDRTVNIQLG